MSYCPDLTISKIPKGALCLSLESMVISIRPPDMVCAARAMLSMASAKMGKLVGQVWARRNE